MSLGARTHHPSTSAKLAPGPRTSGQPRAVAQLGSALDWGSRGRRFKSCQPDKLIKGHLRVALYQFPGRVTWHLRAGGPTERGAPVAAPPRLGERRGQIHNLPGGTGAERCSAPRAGQLDAADADLVEAADVAQGDSGTSDRPCRNQVRSERHLTEACGDDRSIPDSPIRLESGRYHVLQRRPFLMATRATRVSTDPRNARITRDTRLQV